MILFNPIRENAKCPKGLPSDVLPILPGATHMWIRQDVGEQQTFSRLQSFLRRHGRRIKQVEEPPRPLQHAVPVRHGRQRVQIGIPKGILAQLQLLCDFNSQPRCLGKIGEVVLGPKQDRLWDDHEGRVRCQGLSCIPTSPSGGIQLEVQGRMHLATCFLEPIQQLSQSPLLLLIGSPWVLHDALNLLGRFLQPLLLGSPVTIF